MDNDKAIARANAYEPTDTQAAFSMAKWVVSSGMWQHLATPEQAFCVMAQGRELGLSTMQSLNAISVIQGRPTIGAQAMIALVRSRTGNQIWLSHDPRSADSDAGREHAVWTTVIDGRTESRGYSMREAAAAGLTKRTQWQSQPGTMLVWRAASRLCREVYPAILLGVYTPEELEDHAPVRETPSQPTGYQAAAAAVAEMLAPKAIAAEATCAQAPERADAKAIKRRLAQIQRDAVRIAAGPGPTAEEQSAAIDKIKAAWYGPDGVGDVRGIDDADVLAAKLAVAQRIYDTCGDWGTVCAVEPAGNE